MNLVICMAGIYRRFREAGYRVPKFLLPWDGTCVLGAILDHLLMDGSFAHVLLVANRRDESARAELEGLLVARSVDPRALVFVDDTGGQAETAAIGCRALDALHAPRDRRVVFHNADTVLVGRDFAAVGAQLGGADGWIDTFEAHSPAYSYVAVDDAGRVTAIAEKVVISRHATSGCYAFGSMDRFLVEADVAPTTAGERYISAVYQRMLAAGADVRAGLPEPRHRTIILGTPAEYEAAVRQEVR